MNFLDLVYSRYSCRDYSPAQIPRESLECCLDAARVAPSACNSQPWHFIVVQDPVLKQKLAEAAFSGLYAMNAFAKQAPVLVVVIRECSAYAARLGGSLRGIPYSLIDLGIAVEHFILQAQEEGLGSCWLGWFHERAVKKILNIPRGKRVDIIISVGYPKEKSFREKNRKPLKEIGEIR